MVQQRSEPDESAVRDAWDRGQFESAAAYILELYGGELLTFLHALARPPLDADELFSELCERLWLRLPSFRWQSSVRTWMYVIARNLVRSGHRATRGPSGRVAYTDDFSHVANVVRSSTPPYLRTKEKTRLQRIREGLEPDEQTLLILRVDRDMAWNDIADVLAEADDARPRTQRAAALRKRFERLKDRLRREMRENE